MTRGFLRAVLVAACALSLGGTALGGTALAGNPSPAGAEPRTGHVTAPALPTGLFGLDVDLSAVGVSDAELATVGPDALAAPTTGDKMLTVDDGLDCPNAEYPTIQSAVTAAAPGAKIKVCRGVYVEQVVIPAGKDGLTLFSEGHLAARIQAPPAMLDAEKAIVRVSGAKDVTIRHFTISGPGGGPCFSLDSGVRVDQGGSATIENNHITEIRDTPFGGCQNGLGVLVGETGQASAVIRHNLIDRYQKGGVVVSGAGSYAEVGYNEIVGPGVQPTIAPNGVQVSFGAAGDVHHNEITGNNYSGPFYGGTGVLVWTPAAGGVEIGFNDVYRNDDGISLYETEGALVEHNRSYEQLIWDGLYAAPDSTGNTFSHNRAYLNREHDCHDDGANTWVKNYGLTENRPGLCRKATAPPTTP